jgi:hypothetical protein
VAAKANVVAFMAFHCIRIVDGVSLVVFISGEALAIVADLTFEMLELRFRRGGSSGFPLAVASRPLALWLQVRPKAPE